MRSRDKLCEGKANFGTVCTPESSCLPNSPANDNDTLLLLILNGSFDMIPERESTTLCPPMPTSRATSASTSVMVDPSSNKAKVLNSVLGPKMVIGSIFSKTRPGSSHEMDTVSTRSRTSSLLSIAIDFTCGACRGSKPLFERFAFLP